MKLKLSIITALTGLLCSSAALMCSEQAVKKFYQATNKGFYQVTLDLAKQRNITQQEILSSRDGNGSSLVGAAIEGYDLAAKKYGAVKAAQLLYDTLSLLLVNIPKKQAIKLLNAPNNSGITPLFISAQLGLLKVVVLLHNKGALSVIDSKKASSFANNAMIRTTLQQWENLEADWDMMPGVKN